MLTAALLLLLLASSSEFFASRDRRVSGVRADNGSTEGVGVAAAFLGDVSVVGVFARGLVVVGVALLFNDSLLGVGSFESAPQYTRPTIVRIPAVMAVTLKCDLAGACVMTTPGVA